MGFGDEQKATFTAELDRARYRLGDIVNVKITTDNRNCDKPIEQIVLKFSMRGFTVNSNILIRNNII
jgi:hypothetical protein